MLDQPLDRTVLAGAVAAFQDDEHPCFLFDQLALQLHQLDLQLAQCASIMLVQTVLFVVHDSDFLAIRQLEAPRRDRASAKPF